MALIRSLGAMEVTPTGMPSASCICGVRWIDLAVRGKTPPPAEISLAS